LNPSLAEFWLRTTSVYDNDISHADDSKTHCGTGTTQTKRAASLPPFVGRDDFSLVLYTT
jgi:hypothetical protein